jgi:hypothetical protein
LRLFGLILLILPLGIALAEQPATRYRHDDARAMVAHYAETLSAGDAMVAWSYADRYELAYYWERAGLAAQRVTLPEGADLEQVLPLLPDARAIELNVWYTQRADVRQMTHCVLGNGTRSAPATFTTYGMASERFEDTVVGEYPFAPLDRPFGDAHGPIVRLSAARPLPLIAAHQAICLPVEATLLRTTDLELKIALILRNAFGWEIARADQLLATANQRTSEMLAAGETLRAFPLLRLPAGTPSGTYTVYARVSDETADASGLQPIAQTDASGRDIPLAALRVTQGDWVDTTAVADASLTELDLAITPELTLLAASFDPDTRIPARNGDVLPLTLLWLGTGRVPSLMLAAEDGSWQTPLEPSVQHAAGLLRDWRALPIPADASAGPATLRLPDDTVLAQFDIDALPLRAEPPTFALPLDGAFPEIGRLAGATLPEAFSLIEPPRLRLTWQSSGPAERAWTVFVQILDVQGRVIAQSDQMPAAGARPTTSWRAGEWIEDAHTLAWNALAAPGEARLIVGLYDAGTGERAPLAGGGDAYTLAIIEIGDD